MSQAIEQAGVPAAWIVSFDAKLGGARVTDKLLVWRKEQAVEQVKADLIQSVDPLYTHPPTAPAQQVIAWVTKCGENIISVSREKPDLAGYHATLSVHPLVDAAHGIKGETK